MYSKGKSAVFSTLVMYSRKNSRLEHPEIGITVSKKLGGAVERNRARRLVREAWRQLVSEREGLSGQPFYIVFVARSRCFKKKTKMQDVKRDIERGLSELGID